MAAVGGGGVADDVVRRSRRGERDVHRVVPIARPRMRSRGLGASVSLAVAARIEERGASQGGGACVGATTASIIDLASQVDGTMWSS